MTRLVLGLTAVGAIAGAAPAFATPNLELPASVVNGRFFYEPTVASHHLRIWLDTNGEGFVTRQCARALGLSAGDRVTLPQPVVPPTAFGGRLPVVDPDPGDRIFQGIDAQFGATWFQGRVVVLDYPHQRLQIVGAPERAAGRLGWAQMRFPEDPGGGRIEGKQYPSVDVAVASGAPVAMSFDSAATVALTSSAVRALNDGWGAVRATSFVTRAAMASWHGSHPSWRYLARAGGEGIDLLQIPELTIGHYRARDVWFSTRPRDDVFSNESVVGKIGPTAFARDRVTLDYPAGRLYFDP